jgi:N-acetylglutamate synthase-like GNAT family acetyltransferase
MAMKGQMIIALRDGVCLPVRRIRAEDAAALQRLVGRSSDRSVELRFFGPLKELSDEMAERFADVDGEDRYAVVALDPERGTDGAEYAALIEDRFQHRGLGIGLTRNLIEAARENGIRHLHALVLRENAGMLSLLRSLDLPERLRWKDGAECVELDLSS